MVEKYRRKRSITRSVNDNIKTTRINSRCQPRCVVNIVKNFDETKRNLVRETGLGGTLSMKLTKVNRQFGAWLLSKIDHSSCAIIPDVNKKIPISSKEINLLFGLPCSGKPIESCNHDEIERNKRIICEIFGVSHFSKVTVKLLEEILQKQYPNPLSLNDQ